MKRGMQPIYVHIHGFATNEEAAQSKIPTLFKILQRYYPWYNAYYVPSTAFQVSAAKAGKFELILLKCFMLKVAEMIAKKDGATLIFTGESLGQVSSQTPTNLHSEGQGISFPILRPLIGFDKQEIISVARKIGTFEESIKEYRDVCSINSKYTVTSTNPKFIKKLAKDIGIDKIAKRSVKLAKAVST
jgi:thiamine biosynthesis protein ThiI